jgi:hypothetical protein
MTPKQRGFREEMRAHLAAHGLHYGKSTINKLCAPAEDKGPPVWAWLGRRPIYDFDEALAWAEAQLRPSRQGSIASLIEPRRSTEGTPASDTLATEQKIVEAASQDSLISAPNKPGTCTSTPK